MDEQPQAERRGGPRPRPRPSVSVPSLLGAAAGILLLGSLSGFLSELSGERLRVGGLGLSLIFEALGVVLLVVGQGRRASTAGVTLAALGVIPLVFFTFFDARNETTLVGGDDVLLSATIALLVAAGLWLAGHLFGPSQSHALFLGAALVAVWLAITIQVVDDDAQPRFELLEEPVVQFDRPALGVVPETGGASGALRPASTATIDNDVQRRLDEYEKYDNGQVVCTDGILVEGDDTFWECDGDLAFPISVTTEDDSQFEDDFFTEDDFGTDGEFQFEGDLGGYEDEFGNQYPYDDGFTSYDDDPVDMFFPYGSGLGGAAGRFGSVTLAFGLLYLAGGALFDRAGDTRRGTAFFAVASPLTYLGISSLDLDEPWLMGLLFLLVGGAAAWLGAAHDRRFTAWFGVLNATGGVVLMVIDIFGEDPSGTTIGLMLLVIGLAVAAAAHVLERGPGDVGWQGPAGPGGPPLPLPVPSPASPAGTGTEPPAGPPLVQPPGSQWQPVPGATGTPTTPVAPAPDESWAPPSRASGAAGADAPPAFDPRPPGWADPLPPDPGHGSDIASDSSPTTPDTSPPTPG